ncbi:MAG: hypothetical protein JNM27_13725 [Leptospirales bacterium]|nr:hypothetical protein [Leptospirales bacterium]
MNLENHYIPSRLQSAFNAKAPELIAIQRDPALLLAYLGWQNAPAWASSILQHQSKSLILTSPPKSTLARIIVIAIALHRLFTDQGELVRHMFNSVSERKATLHLLRRFVQTFRALALIRLFRNLGLVETAWHSAYHLVAAGQMETKATTLTVLDSPSIFPDITGNGDSIVLTEFSKLPTHLSQQGFHWHAVCPECRQQNRSDLFFRMTALELRCPNCNSNQAPIQGTWDQIQPSKVALFHINSLMDPSNREWQKALASARRKRIQKNFGAMIQIDRELRFDPLRLENIYNGTESFEFANEVYAGIDWGQNFSTLCLVRPVAGTDRLALTHVQAFPELDNDGDVEQMAAVLRAERVHTVVHDSHSIGRKPGKKLRQLVSPQTLVVNGSVSTGRTDLTIGKDTIRFDKEVTAMAVINALNHGELVMAPDVFRLRDWPEAHAHLSAVRVRLTDLKYQVSPRRSRDDFSSSTTLAFLAAKHFSKVCGVSGG